MEENIDQIQELFTPECRLCPRQCEVNRQQGETGYCGVGDRPLVASSFAHRGEERPLSGRRGSGTIFFSGCNLKCDFCQNADISHQLKGTAVSRNQLAELMLELEDRSCHNINLVTPSHVIAQILPALRKARDKGLNLPVVYNCGGYESPEVLRQLEGLVDIYMPDFKFWSKSRAKKYMEAPDYPERAKKALKIMHRQVGELKMDNSGVARQGLLVRHLVMPNCVEESKKILNWIKETLSRRTYLNIMGQYRPAHQARRHEEINRQPEPRELQEVRGYARKIELTRLD